MKKIGTNVLFVTYLTKKGKNEGLNVVLAAIFGGIFAPKYEL